MEPKWIWNKILFQPADAAGTRFQTEQVSMFEGQEVREWIKVKRSGGEGGVYRVYPVVPDGRIDLPDVGPDGVIRGGWDHEHCELCHAHIGPGDYGYVDLGEHWVCEKCHGKYIVTHDLSFLDTSRFSGSEN